MLSYIMTHPFTWTIIGLLVAIYSFRYFWVKTLRFLRTKDTKIKPTCVIVWIWIIFSCVFLWNAIISVGLIIWG